MYLGAPRRLEANLSVHKAQGQYRLLTWGLLLARACAVGGQPSARCNQLCILPVRLLPRTPESDSYETPRSSPFTTTSDSQLLCWPLMSLAQGVIIVRGHATSMQAFEALWQSV